ncbi:hypothetical protein M8J77_007189 [Diaphorina citri]|nr:hypothetical protein M8J77_007189 [Diaphorina citri]
MVAAVDTLVRRSMVQGLGQGWVNGLWSPLWTRKRQRIPFNFRITSSHRGPDASGCCLFGWPRKIFARGFF